MPCHSPYHIISYQCIDGAYSQLEDNKDKPASTQRQSSETDSNGAGSDDVRPPSLDPDVKRIIRSLEKKLQTPPSGLVRTKGMNGDTSTASSSTGSASAIVEGVLDIQRHDQQVWKRKYVQYHDGIFRRQDYHGDRSEDAKPGTSSWKSLALSFVVEDPLVASFHNRQLTDAKNPNVFRIDAMPDKHCFRILTSDTSYQCRAVNERDCMRWHQIILRDLQSLHNDDEWHTKMMAARDLAEQLKKLFDYELARYTLLCFRVANAGLMDTRSSPLRTKNRAMSGVLNLYHRGIAKDYYFVLVGTTLMYAIDAKMSIPSGIIVLKYCEVYAHAAHLRKKDYVFTVKTPLNTYQLRAKHDVALAEWLHACEEAMSRHPNHATAAEALMTVQRMCSDVSNMQALLEYPPAFLAMSEFIRDFDDLNLLHWWQDVQELEYKLDSDDGDPLNTSAARDLLSQYSTKGLAKIGGAKPLLANDTIILSSSSPSTPAVSSIPVSTSGESKNGSSDNGAMKSSDTAHELRALKRTSITYLSATYFEDFKRSHFYHRVIAAITAIHHDDDTSSPPSSSVTSSSTSPATVPSSNSELPKDTFDEKAVKLVLRQRISRKHMEREAKAGIPHDATRKFKFKVFTLPPGKSSLTIGRDKANYISVSGGAVSRTHCRLEWDKKEIVVVDMGSTFGSKLNGSSVVRSALSIGDVIEIGHSTITLRAIDYTDDDLQALLHRSKGVTHSGGHTSTNKKCVIM